MNIDEFVERSLGNWRSQRSAHHLAFRHFEEVSSEIEIQLLTPDDERVLELCKANQVDPHLIREQGYAETVPAIGIYQLVEDDSFVLTTMYERAAAEEKIWFATPNLRMRVSLIKTGDGKGVTTASFSSEIRLLDVDTDN